MKRFITKIINAYWLKEYIMLLRYYKISFKSTPTPMLISVVDNKRHCQGLTDRLKGIVTVYALSKAMNIRYKCIFTHPFLLSDFLIPNEYDWQPAENELSDTIKDVRFKIMRKEPTLKRLLRIFPTNKQIHVYANYDYLEEINQKFKQNFQWGELFRELFKPSPELEMQLSLHLKNINEGEYIACTFRFQSLLGDFKEYNYQALSPEKQDQLIEKNRNALSDLLDSANCPILVTSDSMLFISQIKDLKNIYTLPGKVVHLDCVSDERNDVYMKSFIDFFMLSKAKKIYSIGTKIMYPTNFPVYAAKINNIPFERILID
jgi:hypothetical protein